MNPIHNRFSNIEVLRHSSLDDIQALKSEGHLEVNGKSYKISAAESGEITVLKPDQPSKANKFFKVATHLVGVKSQREQIAQVINEKMATAPRLDRMPGRRMNPEEGGSSSVANAIKLAEAQLSAKKTFASLQQWAEAAQKARRKDEEHVYMMYKDDVPGTTPMNTRQQSNYLHTLKALNEQNQLIIRPQSQDHLRNKELDLNAFMAERPESRDGFYRLMPKKDRDPGKNSGRLTIGVEPKYAAQLAHAMVTLIDRDKSVTQGKVAGPANYGKRTDSAILYINGDLETAARLAEELKTLSGIPADGFVEHTPLSMQSTGRGFSYAEDADKNQISHGLSRARVIVDALKLEGPLDARLKTALAAHGFDTENPALRKSR
ncbi:T3SS effector HopA1 family protein [Pseudomonas syringae]|uniref:T3SS effector HopA1 family protein n=1 Tax=Pseudomonas syringae TaxID=317 RepID=UPI0018E5E130|nr:T3SS effector HopA1 family protein [Pseudomonas syringae]MBI6738608.1 protein hrmA [Pseudomonas syringae]MBI6744508.1 protein hrmA [Pseudomonas syringae]MBI6759473.1 protein hrmA [Pseudomonas syringae]MBI6766488.1 protein hrmA [Pseudomonas syringae]MBI6788724.1 protein hrmA [Pseudomonas syringae]